MKSRFVIVIEVSHKKLISSQVKIICYPNHCCYSLRTQTCFRSSAKGQPEIRQRSQATVAMVGNKLHLQVDSEINL